MKKIQVIERMFSILEVLNKCRAAYLRELAEVININKTTLHGIICSLLELGYLEKDDSGRYRISEKFTKLALYHRERDMLTRIAIQEISSLCDEIKESVVVALLEDNKRVIIASADYGENVVMVNSKVHVDGTIYSKSTGRALLSVACDEDRKLLIKKSGLPSEEEWAGIDSTKKLNEELNSIRESRISVMVDKILGLVGIAVPVVAEDAKLCIAIGVYYPETRHSKVQEQRIIEGLKKASEHISAKLRTGIMR